MRRKMLSVTAAAASLAILSLANSTHAETIYGLTVPGTGQQIIRVDSATPGTLIGSVAISGTTGAETIADIDVFPVTLGLVGIGTTTGTLYDINPLTGAATVNVVPASSINTPQDIDFNPVADRLRVASSGNSNFRVTPTGFNNGGLTAGQVTSDGNYVFAVGDVNAAATPNLVGNAYTNNFDGAATTSLYSIDTGLNALILHTTAPAFSTLSTVGALTSGGNPLPVGSLVGFDISANTGIAYLSDGNALYSLNLATADATSLGSLFGFAAVQSLAVASVPEPTSMAALLVLGGACLARRRSRAS